MTCVGSCRIRPTRTFWRRSRAGSAFGGRAASSLCLSSSATPLRPRWESRSTRCAARATSSKATRPAPGLRRGLHVGRGSLPRRLRLKPSASARALRRARAAASPSDGARPSQARPRRALPLKQLVRELPARVPDVDAARDVLGEEGDEEGRRRIPVHQDARQPFALGLRAHTPTSPQSPSKRARGVAPDAGAGGSPT